MTNLDDLPKYIIENIIFRFESEYAAIITVLSLSPKMVQKSEYVFEKLIQNNILSFYNQKDTYTSRQNYMLCVKEQIRKVPGLYIQDFSEKSGMNKTVMRKLIGYLLQQNNYYSIVRLFQNIDTQYHQILFRLVCCNRYINIIKYLLLQSDLNINLKYTDLHGMTILEHTIAQFSSIYDEDTVTREKIHVAKLLIQYDPNINLTSSIKYAREYSYLNILDYLLEVNKICKGHIN
jgi:hypothetical protein